MLRAEADRRHAQRAVGALTGLVEGHFPVAAPAKYADDAVAKLAKQRVKTGNAAVTDRLRPQHHGHRDLRQAGLAGDRRQRRQDGQDRPEQAARPLHRAPGRDRQRLHVREPGIDPEPVPGAEAGRRSPPSRSPRSCSLRSAPRRAGRPAPALSRRRRPQHREGDQRGQERADKAAVPLAVTSRRPATSRAASRSRPRADDGRRRRADDRRADGQGAAVRQPAPPGLLRRRRQAPDQNSGAADLELPATTSPTSCTWPRTSTRSQPLKAGAVVVAGTILGRIGAGHADGRLAPGVHDPPGRQEAPYIDPKPILDGWKLLEATAVYRAAGVDPFFGPGAKNPTIGQILLMSKEQLQTRVLADPHVKIYSCGRRDIQAGLIDRRVLAVIEFLAASGLEPDGQRARVRPQPTGADRRRPGRAPPARASTSRRSTTSRSWATRAPARSPTSRSAGC